MSKANGGYEKSLYSIVECMFDVFESEFSTWNEASEIIGSEEWVMNNPENALELTGCFFSSLSDDNFKEALDESFEDFDEELEYALEEFEDALDDIEF